MLSLVKSIRWHAWAALLAGLFAGYLCRSSNSAPHGEMASARQAKNSDPRGEVVLPKGPTALYLEEIAGISAARCEELFGEMAGPEGSRDAVQLQCLFARWVKMEDPKLILARLEAQSEIAEKTWTGPFFEAWAAMDYAGALAGTAKSGKFSSIRAIVTVRHRDPAFLKESLAFWDQNSVLAKELASLGREDSELARQISTTGKPANQFDQILAVAGGWASRDPQAALSWINSLEISPQRRTDLLNTIFIEWTKLDLPGAKRAFDANNIAAVVKKANGYVDQNAGILDQPDSSFLQVLHSIQTDPFVNLAGLYQQLSESPVDWQKTALQIQGDSSGWFTTDPAKSAEEATHLPPGKARDFLMSYICAQWADRSPDDALAFAKAHGLREPFFRSQPSAEQISAAFAAPEKIFSNLLAPNSDSSGSQLDQLRQLTEKLLNSNPQKSAELLLPQAAAAAAADNIGSIRDSLPVILGNSIGYFWAKVDANSACDWLTNLPQGPEKQLALDSLDFYIALYSPDRAFTLTASIAEGGKRSGALESAITNVATKIGSPVARELVRTSNLNATEQSALSQVLDKLSTKSTR